MREEEKALEEVRKLCERLRRDGCALLAIDGRCGSGKTTLAEYLHQKYECPVIHMDDFYLPKNHRTKERLQIPGGNVDWERFLQEVLRPLRTGKPAVYRPYYCKENTFGEPKTACPGPLTIIEGSYSLHPSLRVFYDDEVFLTVSKEEQERRILKRSNPEILKIYKENWIPMEERYFSNYRIEEGCSLVLDTTGYRALSF